MLRATELGAGNGWWCGVEGLGEGLIRAVAMFTQLQTACQPLANQDISIGAEQKRSAHASLFFCRDRSTMGCIAD